jgi:penicillin amidase
VNSLKVALILVLVGVAVLAGVLGIRFHQLTRGPLPALQGRVQLSGLRHPVRIVRDDLGAPHVSAETDEDAFFAMGYLTAQERLFQMDLMRRLATGRLAEIVGPDGVALDRLARVVGFARIAEEALTHLSPEARALGESYAAGVNARLAEAADRLPLEFSFLDYAPEPWSVRDSLAIARLQAWHLSGDSQRELLAIAIAAERGEEAVSLLMPGLESWGPYIINPEQRDYSGERATLRAPEQSAVLRPELRRAALALLHAGSASPLGPNLGIASNNWVVDGTKTASGLPILCNDPHLQLPMPGVWMELRLESPSFDVTGVVMPGIPAVILGHNRSVAWGMTTTLADVQDIYIERPDPTAPESRYAVPGGSASYRIEKERIAVRGGGRDGVTDTVEVAVRISRHGPIINDLIDTLPPETPPLALRWAGAEPGDDMSALLGMMRARNWDDFAAALAIYATPIQNFVFAAVDGDIAFAAGGRIPVRAPGHDPGLPVPGDGDAFEWIGWIPPDEMPQVKNPPAGYIASANNKVVPPSYPYYIQSFAVSPYRAARAQELLVGAKDLTALDMVRLQLDDYMVHGRRMAPHFIRVVRAAGAEGPTEAAALAALEAWDYRAALDSVGASVFHMVNEKLIDAVMADELSPELYEKGMGNLFARLSLSGLVDRMANAGASQALWDDRRTEEVETPDAIIHTAFRDAIAEIERYHGKSVDRWRWGELHQQFFAHPSSRIAPFTSRAQRDAAVQGLVARLGLALADAYLGAGPYPLPGATSTLRASPYARSGGSFDAVWGVSFRQIVDMGDVAGALSVIATGNSGHPASPHYRDQVDLWLRGDYHPMEMDLESGGETPREALILEPPARAGESS